MSVILLYAMWAVYWAIVEFPRYPNSARHCFGRMDGHACHQRKSILFMLKAKVSTTSPDLEFEFGIPCDVRGASNFYFLLQPTTREATNHSSTH